MALIKTTDKLKEYVSVNRLDYDNVLPYIKKAERSFIKPEIGLTMLNAYSSTEPSGSVEKSVYNLLQESVANLAFFIYVPIAQLQITDHGIATSQGQDYKSAEWWQIRDLRRSFLENGFNALDEALQIMEENSSRFNDWVESSSYSVYNRTFIKNTTDFNTWFSIGQSRRTFNALKPYLLEVHHQYLAPTLQKEDLDVIIKSKKIEKLLESATEEEKVVAETLNYFQAAQANFTVAKAIESGMFEIAPDGISQVVSDFPGFKQNAFKPDVLDSMRLNRLNVAEEYLSKALKIIKQSPDYFSVESGTSTTPALKIKNTKSTLAL